MGPTANTMHDAGIRKAAILVASLDQGAADRLLDQLGPEYADRVRQAVLAIDRIDAEEQRRVIDDFRRIGPMVPDQCPAGIDLDGLALPPEPACSFVAESAELPVPSDASPFGFLREAEEDDLSQLLGSERPQTIALVLSHLSPQRAGEVLTRLTRPLQVEVVRRLAELDTADPETLREVEQTLEARWSRRFATERGRAAGPETVARILAACDSQVMGSILDNVAEYDAQLAERLGRPPFTFDDLVQLDDAALLEIFRTAEPEVALAALLGTPPPLVERILRGMAPEESSRLRRRLDCPGPIRLSDIDDARQQIAVLAQQMSRRNPSKTALAA